MNEPPFTLAYVIHQKDNLFPGELQHLSLILTLRYQQSQHLKIAMAWSGLPSRYDVWRHANHRTELLDARFGLQM